MALILSIETSTDVCSVALHRSGELLKSQIHQIEKSHSSLLPGIACEIIEEAELAFPDLDAVAISAGPGSYTGLRIGVTTAKGFCFASNIPFISVDTLDVVIAAVDGKFKGDHNLCPMLDARRMEVYTKMVNQDLVEVWPLQAKILTETSFKEITDPTYIFGNGMAKFREIVNQDNLIFIEEIIPDARNMGQLAFRKFENSEFEDVAYFEPKYLKEWRTTTQKKQLL
ncbi:MAG: tRNA (adenosine(37)-N6)-threonylcarbamoyltransferase complex dimerization subunit type 1 TsaB [Cyclobacteriaceae bacterium]